MARLGAKVVGWFYPTPLAVIPAIMSFVEVPMGNHTIAVVDPCAADGTAVNEVCKAIAQRSDDVEGSYVKVKLFACELEEKRFESLKGLSHSLFRDEKSHGYSHHSANNMVLHGDGLKVVWNTDWDGASFLFLNPPYEEKSLEVEFVQRYVQCLSERGILVLIVPYKALDRIAPILARTCQRITCFRFPAELFTSFGQVVIFAERRSTLIEPDPVVLAHMTDWCVSPNSIPELPTIAPERLYKIPALDNPGFFRWAMTSVDVPRMLAEVRPWHTTDRGGKLRSIPGIAPTRPISEMLERRYLLAMPPKQAHIAGALASGVFNGAVVRPNDPTSGLPSLLVNGVFRKEFKHLEDKVDKEGEKTGEIRVEAPKLVITVLDLDNLSFHTLTNDPNPSGSRDVATMNAADFIEFYGLGLLDVMKKQCPVVHDPDDPAQEFPLPTPTQPLFRVQRHAVMALVKLLGGANVHPAKRRNLRAGLDGEMGTGKTRMGAMTAKACGAKRVLVMCPTHLLTTWPEEIAIVDPDAKIVVLDDVVDVMNFFADKYEGMMFGIISKEGAKLSHRWADIGALSPNLRRMCPRCGSAIATKYDGELAAKRTLCPAQELKPSNKIAHVCQNMALHFLPFTYDMPDMWSILAGRNLRRFVHMMDEKLKALDKDARAAAQTVLWDKARHGERFAKTIRSFVKTMIRSNVEKDREVASECLSWLLHARDDINVTIDVCRTVHESSLEVVDGAEKRRGEDLRAWVRAELLHVDFDRADVAKFVEELRRVHDADIITTYERSLYGRSSYPVENGAWHLWEKEAQSVRRGNVVNEFKWHGTIHDNDVIIRGKKLRVWNDIVAGSIDCARQIITLLYKHSRWSLDIKCGEPLFQAIPDPRRYPLANFISAKYPRAFDFYICDEVHDMKGDGTAQSFAFHRLSMCGAPSLFMTGTWMNGKADSLFNVQWEMDPEFRQEFGFGDRSKFKEIFGYRKVEVSYRESDTKRVVEYGTSSDRVEVVMRDVGDAPGILPIFLPRFMLRRVVVVHKSELDSELPPCREFVETIACDADQLKAHKDGSEKLLSQIRRDKRTARVGKLFGALSEFQTHPDRCNADTGNAPDGSYEVRYPEEVLAGRKRKPKKKGEAACGELLFRMEPFPADRVMPKEARAIEIVRAQLARGRKCLVFAWNEAVLPRLKRVIEEAIGEPVGLLETNKVDPYKRKDWINTKVLGKGVRVLVVSPAAVQTGLNNLIAFPTQIWLANPAVNPTIYRQARDRSHRIGQTQEVEIYYLLYGQTAQVPAHKLLKTKVGVAMSTDGLDARSVLLAAGIGESDTFDLLSVGKQLFELMAA